MNTPKNNSANKVRGVLFDVDGTLVDSTFIHTLCWWQSFRQFDQIAPMAVIHRAIGMGGSRLVEHLLGADHPSADELTAAHDALYSAYWTRLVPSAGARALLRACKAAGLITVLASSAAQREVEVLLEVLDESSSIDHVTSSSDADSSKPDPDIVEVALTKAGLAPDEAVFVGDAVWDVEAAARAGVPCIGLECGGTSELELSRAGAVATYRDPAALLESFDRSLLGRPRS
ncbi:MAG: HAD-superfamily hydrolase, subfamily variant 3 [Frankiales bacterium]|nr:HAD-superfamily hydrolase, subfamily variant 3 [Frankiales bacterium]